MADWQSLDPEAAREAEKYENPIPSRELILQHLAERGSPASREQLVEEFGLTTEDQFEALRRRLRAMERDAQLIYTRRGTYAPVDKLDLILGRISGHRDGFGFLVPDDGSDDLFMSPAQMRLVFDGDRALARVSGLDRRGRREGVIVEVISRAHETIVGRYFEESGIGFVVPDNPKIQQEVLVTPGRNNSAKIGQFVEVKITHWPTPRFQPQGDVVEVVGNYMAPGMEIDVALRTYDIPHVWPEAVLKEAARLKPEVEEKDKENRVDLRHLPFVTIDGEDARDFDDAVYCEAKPGKLRLFSGGWKLYVAIADVSSYVKIGSALDAESQVRGNSVYFPERVVPMLPEQLSNGLCSLNPHVDRLAMVCEMTISKTGEMTDYVFYEGIIHSHARLTYNKVSTILEQPKTAEAKSLRGEYGDVVPHLKQLYAMYKVLLGARHVRGAIDFETQETRIIFGSERKIAEIRPTTRNDAHKLIEECMLAANVATAQFLKKHEIPALYRVHDGPPPERLEKLRAFLGELGLSLHKGKDGPTPKDYQALLETVRDRPDYHLIQTVMLRSLSQAVYSSDNNGHFGLNYEAYTHFTSPIRRYPDLLTHRAIRSVIRSKQDTPHVRRAGAATIPKARIYPYDDALLDQLGEQCSMSERRADEATRDVVNWLKCEYMKDRVGESFPGVITAVTGFGLFVELTDIYVEGLVHVTALPGDYYHFDPLHHRLAGERTGRNFRLGDTVEVRVMRVDLDERKIDFEISETAAAATPVGRKRRGHDTAPPAATAAEKDKAPAAKSGRGKSSAKETGSEAYRPGDAAAKNAEVRKSRELKKALLADAKGGSKASSGKSDRSGSVPSSDKPASKHRKGPSKTGSAPAAKSSGARKPKAKS
ncbi:Ribonuclease R [Pseudomonas syringae pv. cilantro]|uniref:Ribonuclease R n=2 Tax=Pseudomonas syringae group TaxID=136849 RepID=A0A0N0XCC9_PSESX|nr:MULTISPECIES: ribonuclease R [Pseudomonas syringae group]KPC35584.1 Ribonuclease R [Pseudomonas syringae pv. cilantro]KPW73803.1 Ribonuclease R [Pseudomonas syringae pv. coriandricola]RMN09413.1 Ribonuclease R [Pseudomonas syringae pv. coriandricola]